LLDFFAIGCSIYSITTFAQAKLKIILSNLINFQYKLLSLSIDLDTLYNVSELTLDLTQILLTLVLLFLSLVFSDKLYKVSSSNIFQLFSNDSLNLTNSDWFNNTHSLLIFVEISSVISYHIVFALIISS
jgi:hypothetical protein